MSKFTVTERQVRIVLYCVEAENETDARDRVSTGNVDDYCELIDVPETKILNVKEIAS